jgi:hypothetical protein
MCYAAAHMKVSSFVLVLLALSATACGAQKPPTTPAQTTLTNALLPDPDSSLLLDTVDPWQDEPAPAAPKTWGTSAEEQPRLPKYDELGNPMHL